MLVCKHLSFRYHIVMKDLSVLVIESSKPMRDLVVSILEEFGFDKILTADEGERAFQLYQHHKPDMIIMDWHIDGDMNGLELCQWIRRNKHSSNRTVPIIFLTGYADHLRIEKARDQGVTEILIKPFTAKDLARRILHVIDAPRDFVESLNFFGPDRRRRGDDDFEGKDRRAQKPEEI